MNKRLMCLLAGLTTILLLAIVACANDLTPLEQRVTELEGTAIQMAPEPTTKEFYLTGVEWKGTTSADQLDPPAVDPKALSKGYGFKGPGFDADKPENWQVATYVWTPGAMVVNEGDTVDLTAFIVNGNHHESKLIAPDGSEVGEIIEMNRGREYHRSFKAEQAGVYLLVCETHAPSMTATITVLPSS